MTDPSPPEQERAKPDLEMLAEQMIRAHRVQQRRRSGQGRNTGPIPYADFQRAVRRMEWSMPRIFVLGFFAGGSFILSVTAFLWGPPMIDFVRTSIGLPAAENNTHGILRGIVLPLAPFLWFLGLIVWGNLWTWRLINTHCPHCDANLLGDADAVLTTQTCFECGAAVLTRPDADLPSFATGTSLAAASRIGEPRT